MLRHPTAIISADAQIDPTVQIGPYCIIDGKVTIKAGVVLHSHVCLSGNTTIGEGTEIFPFAAIGNRPQDLKYRFEDSRLVIGRNNVIREYVTIHPGTAAGAMETAIGDNCLLMVAVHVAHDCKIGNGVIMANNASLAGHVEVGDGAILGGMSGYKQFVRIGKKAIIGGGSMVDSDVIPYGQVSGERANLMGLNVIGMQRDQTPKSDIHQACIGFEEIFFDNGENFATRVQAVAKGAAGNNQMVKEIIEFIYQGEGRRLCFPPKAGKDQ